MRGFAPVLDGTAAPYVEFPCTEFGDGTWEVAFPDGSVGLFSSWEECGKGIVAWLKAKDPQHRD